ncbi:hypothetical protein P171DRAFT_496523 [Karstenula rhodostoma CBS 690.94]|uniref:Rhodopsin domain-containing protein n=1 Tax=Karstenula rhodostoma CBS 690.94 TaxID=1392251 RepID=A0A9P4PDS7_9PLEO|nr:hypothetical protein P171DRAFT_496523 [Karstenula rhodostoma CBS 690.94]
MADVTALRRHANLFRRGGGLDIPADVIISWPAPNYINPEIHSDSGPIVVIVFLALSILVYLARMWARVVTTKTAGLDDWIMTSAIIPLIAAAIAVVLACQEYGYRRHTWDQTPDILMSTRKISILSFYKRITTGSISKAFIYWTWGSIAFVIAYFFAFSLAIIFSCSPIEGYWYYYDITWRVTHELKCNDEGALTVSAVVIGTLLDFYLCALPVLLIWNVKISKRQKAALCGIFGFGLLTCLCGVMRAYYAITVYYTTYDITWYAWYGWVWTALEAQLGVMCACAPALKGFFKRYFSLNTARSNDTGRKSSSGRVPGYGKLSAGDSLATSALVEEHVRLNRIKVSTTANMVKDGDNRASIGSSESTRYLTALPMIVLPLPVHGDERATSPSIWNGNRTVITTYQEEHEFDMEKNARDA